MWVRILAYAKPYWRTLFGITLLIIVMAGLNQVEPFITKNITDSLIDKPLGQSFSAVVFLLGLLLVVKLLQSSLNRLSWSLATIFSVKFESSLKQQGFNHLLKLSLAFFNDQESGKIMSKLDRGVNRLVTIVNNSGMHFLPSVTTALISFAIVMFYEWRIGVLTIIAFVPYVLINHWRFQRNNKLEKQEYKLYDQQYAHFWEVVSSMELIKSFRAERFERRKLASFFTSYLGIRRKMEGNTNKAFAGDIILELLSWVMYAYIVWITWQGQISVGTLVLLVGLIGLIRQPLWQINWIFWEVKRAQIGARDFFTIMSIEPEIKDPVRPQHLSTVKGEIDFKHVSFAYKKSVDVFLKNKTEDEAEIDEADKKPVKPVKEEEPVQVFDDVTFKIHPGKMTALVGPSGSGKTTIASLVMRFFDPDSGQILLDGMNINQLKQEELRSYIGLVSQTAVLFADTIEENLRYAKPTATEAEMRAACKAARANEFIDRLPEGLKTQIGERGVKLSGGQRQRLSLARTILRSPQIVILDEATSALDSESELYIQQALSELLKNRTSIVIAHRLSTVQRADNIIVLKDKQVLEQGSHAELMNENGLYASLFKIQSGDIKTLEEWELIRD